MRTFCIGLLFLLFGNGLKAQGQDPIQWVGILTDTTHVKRELANTYELFPIPVAGVGLFMSDTVLACKAVGISKWPNGAKVTERQLFHLGGNAVNVTSYLAARLVSEGKIRWETTFFSLFPKLKDKVNPAYHAMTLKDLLSHRARVRPYSTTAELVAFPKLRGNDVQQRRKFVQEVLNNPPGDTGLVYSNGGVALAAIMLEMVSQKTYKDLLDKYLTKEFGVRAYMGWPNQFGEMQPWGHWMPNSKQVLFTPVSKSENAAISTLFSPACHLSMTLRDMMRFYQVQLRGIQGKHPRIPKQTYEFMHYGLPTYSLGWLHKQDPGSRVSTHDGSAGTFYAHVTLLPDVDLGILIVTNTAGGPTNEAVAYLRTAVLTKVFDQPVPEMPKASYDGHHPLLDGHDHHDH
jgi:CubicO group peptidase (beta-lactamase class C family)